MRAATSTWSRSVNHLFGSTRAGAPPRRAERRPRRRAYRPLCGAAEVLEGRALLSAAFGSALSLGNDAGSSRASDVATDQAGNSYLTGTFAGTVDFDPAATHAGDTDLLTAGSDRDLYVAKYAADGSFLWASQMVGAAGSTSFATSVTTDARGNVYIGGYFTGSISFGALTLTSGGDTDAFVAKLGPDGTVLWANRWGGADKEYVGGVAVDDAGNVLAAGSTTRLNPDGLTAYTNLQVEKFGASGAALWAKQIGNTNGGSEAARGIGADSAGNVYVSGSFKGTVDFDPGPAKHTAQGPLSDHNGFVLKLTAGGDFGWVTPFVAQSSSSCDCDDLAVDGSGNIVVSGSYNLFVDFDPGKGTRLLPITHFTGPVVMVPGFIAKLNPAGALVWAQQVAAGPADSLALDGAGNVYATGIFIGQGDADPGAGTTILTSNGNTDVYVTKFTAAGTYQWAVGFGGTGWDFTGGIAVDSAGNVSVAGLYYGTVDFDPDPLATYYLTNPGTFSNAFLLRLRQV